MEFALVANILDTESASRMDVQGTDGDGGSDLIKVFDSGLPEGFPGRFTVHEDWGCGFAFLGFVAFVAVVLVLKHFLFG